MMKWIMVIASIVCLSACEIGEVPPERKPGSVNANTDRINKKYERFYDEELGVACYTREITNDPVFNTNTAYATAVSCVKVK